MGAFFVYEIKKNKIGVSRRSTIWDMVSYLKTYDIR